MAGRWTVRRAGAALAGAAVTLAAAVGCGGATPAVDASKLALASSIAAEYNANRARVTGTPTAPVEPSFLARADAICAPVLDYNSSHPNPYPSFDPTHPDAATLPLEGAYFSASPFNEALRQLAALPPPAMNPATWQAFVATATALRDQVAKQNAAALAGDVTGFTALGAQVDRLQRTIQADAHQAGFDATSVCFRLF